jgi:hypothetical protein
MVEMVKMASAAYRSTIPKIDHVGCL